MPPSCWQCADSALAGSSSLAVSLRFELPSNLQVLTALRSYGHVWALIEKLYFCVESERQRGRQLSELWMPSTYWYRVGGRPVPVLSLAATLLSGRGTGLEVRRVDRLPIFNCRCEGGRCATQTICTKDCTASLDAARNDSTSSTVVGTKQQQQQQRLAILRYVWQYRLTKTWMTSFRAAVWSNLGLRRTPASSSSTAIVFVSNQKASNGRRIIDEDGLAEQTRLFFRRLWPLVPFRHVDLQQFSLKEELALISEARVFISLFGSALHNCRFLPEDAAVVEIYGALKEDWGSPFYYADLCARRMGLRWVGHAPDNAVPNATQVAPHPITGRPRRTSSARQAARATVSAEAFVALLELAFVRGEWGLALEQYAAGVSVGVMAHKGKIHAKEARGLHKLPQYQRIRNTSFT